ncbi:MAG TPA: phosphatidylserine/phosphatidylglycerophosphate/cardiolipin synthase family protein [Candidatus Limnocylindrales bacterium]|nr:phosphatidylserine/phosphatidylglycerophosphate/cardiolipin synthase family protein [Candidatus Limnocylindrales bacterium]
MPLLLLALLLASCASGPLTAVIRPAGPPAAVVGDPQPLRVGADTLLPLPEGAAAFAAIRTQLRSATRTLELELYEFQRQDLAALVLDAKARGVRVTAIIDPSERSSAAIWAALAQGGVEVIPFPIEPRTIDHVKLLIVDGARAIVGGINWGRSSQNNRDYDILASGPVVANLDRVFQADLALAGRPSVVPPAQPDGAVQVLVTRPGTGIRAALLQLIATARQTIDAELFVLSDTLVLEALRAAAQRGVHVRVLLEPGQPQNPGSLRVLLAAGAQAHLFTDQPNQLLHAKLGIFDRARVLFGSCNWSRSGFTRNHELDVEIDDSRIATAFLDRMESDWAAG